MTQVTSASVSSAAGIDYNFITGSGPATIPEQSSVVMLSLLAVGTAP